MATPLFVVGLIVIAAARFDGRPLSPILAFLDEISAAPSSLTGFESWLTDPIRADAIHASAAIVAYTCLLLAIGGGAMSHAEFEHWAYSNMLGLYTLSWVSVAVVAQTGAMVLLIPLAVTPLLALAVAVCINHSHLGSAAITAFAVALLPIVGGKSTRFTSKLQPSRDQSPSAEDAPRQDVTDA